MPDRGRSGGPVFIGRRHEIADRNISRFQEAIRKAQRGEGKANVAHCREMIDKWLDYRHGPDEDRYL